MAAFEGFFAPFFALRPDGRECPFFSLRCLTVVVGVEGAGGGLGSLPEQDPAADLRRQGGGQGSTALQRAEPRAPRVVLVEVWRGWWCPSPL